MTTTALITGGTSGIGRAAANKLAQLGIHVLLVGRNVERGEKTIGLGQVDRRSIALHHKKKLRSVNLRHKADAQHQSGDCCEPRHLELAHSSPSDHRRRRDD